MGFFGEEIMLKFNLNGRVQTTQVACETWRLFIVRRKNMQVLEGKL